MDIGPEVKDKYKKLLFHHSQNGNVDAFEKLQDAYETAQNCSHVAILLFRMVDDLFDIAFQKQG